MIRFQDRRILRPETGAPVPQQQGLSGTTFVAMMQATDLGEGNDLAGGWRVYWPRLGAILVEGEMCSALVMILEITRQDLAQVMLVKNDYVIETLTADRSDEALDICVLPR